MFLDWDLNTAAELANFKAGYYQFKALTTPKRQLLLLTDDAIADETVNTETLINEIVTKVTLAEAELTLVEATTAGSD
jgi:hypothetical protein